MHSTGAEAHRVEYKRDPSQSLHLIQRNDREALAGRSELEMLQGLLARSQVSRKLVEMPRTSPDDGALGAAHGKARRTGKER